MTLRDFLDNILDDVFIALKFNEGSFSSSYAFRKYRVNKSSKLLDCRVQSIGSECVKDDHIVITVYIVCEDLNDSKDFFKRS